MFRALLAVTACALPLAANADFSDDVKKLQIDDRAWFYLRTCATGEETNIRDLIDKYAVILYRKDDRSDAAAEWRSRYRDDFGDLSKKEECTKARDLLRNTIYAPAIK